MPSRSVAHPAEEALGPPPVFPRPARRRVRCELTLRARFSGTSTRPQERARQARCRVTRRRTSRSNLHRSRSIWPSKRSRISPRRSSIPGLRRGRRRPRCSPPPRTCRRRLPATMGRRAPPSTQGRPHDPARRAARDCVSDPSTVAERQTVGGDRVASSLTQLELRDAFEQVCGWASRWVLIDRGWALAHATLFSIWSK